MNFDRPKILREKVAEPKAKIFANILINLFTDRANRIYVSKLRTEHNLSERTIRGYFKELREIITDESMKLGSRMDLIKAKDETRGEYWYLGTASTESDENGNIKTNNQAIDSLNKLLVFYMTERFFERFKAENLKNEADIIYKSLLDSLKYKSDIKDLLDNIDKIFYFFRFAPKECNSKILQTVIDGIINKKVLRLEYFGLGYKKPIQVLVKPLSVIYFEGLLYLLGSGVKRGYRAIRTFAVDRIKKAGYTGKKFHYNYDNFNPEDHINKYIGVMTAEHKTRFELIFKNDTVLKRLVGERKWFENQSFEELEDGRLRMKFSTYLTHEVKRWILSFGNDVKIIKPQGFI